MQGPSIVKASRRLHVYEKRWHSDDVAWLSDCRRDIGRQRVSSICEDIERRR